MTLDDGSSVYVGGLPYDATEDSIRKVFSLYGAVVAVKIVNDHATRGKCYGFVTFTNPRSATQAINDMDGRTIDGRVVKVNEVKTRGGRTNFGRENFQRNNDRGTNWDRARDRERDYERDRDMYRDRNIDRSRERNMSRDPDRGRETEHELARDHGQTRDHILDRDLDRDRDLEDNEKERSRDRDQEWEKDQDLDWDQERETGRTTDHDNIGDKEKEEYSRKQNGSRFIDQLRRDPSSDKSDGYYDNVKEQLEKSIHSREELEKEISQMEGKMREQNDLVSDLQKKSKKLEDELTSTKKDVSRRKMLLSKMHKCYLQVNDYNERLKSCELELQSLVDTAMLECDGDDVDLRVEF